MSKSFKKRAASFLLAALMMVEMLPLTTMHVHAAETGSDDTDLSIDFDYVSEYETAEEALDAMAKEYNSSATITAEQAKTENEESWVKIMDGDLKVTGGKFREAMESSDPDEKYIVLSQDVELRNTKEQWVPIEVKSDKVLDLAGFTMTWMDMTNKDPESDGQSTYVKDHYKDKTFIYVREGATLTIIDSSMPVNGHNTTMGTGKMVANAKMIDAFEEQIDHYTQRDLFLVDGNLVIYGGTFEAGRQKDQWKDNFTWDKLTTTIGNTITLGVSIAEYATSIQGANAVLDDVNRNILKMEPEEENDSDGSETATGNTSGSKPTGEGGTQNATVTTPASAGANGDPSKNRAQTIGERTENANANDAANKPSDSGSSGTGTAKAGSRAGGSDSGSGSSSGSSGSGSGSSGSGSGSSGSGSGSSGSGSGGNGKNTGSSAAQTGGENTANAQGTAKEEWVKDKFSQIAVAEKGVVNAALDKEKLMEIYDGTMTVIKNIASMIGVVEGTRMTHTIHGTVAQLNATGTLVVYDGMLRGHGSSEHTRNATIEVTRLGDFHEYDEMKQKNEGGSAYIFGGTVEAYAGANCFNMVRYNAEVKVMRQKSALKGSKENGLYYYVPIDREIYKQYEGVYPTDEQLANAAYEEYKLPLSETNELEILHYENQEQVREDESVKPIPIDTSNIVVRGGTFRCYHEPVNVGTRLVEQINNDPNGDEWTFSKVTGTSGSVNLGLESFGEDMIRDGRIQLNDVYGDGSLVLMDEAVDAAHPAGLKHYRLYCGDTELRHIRYLEVYPMNAGANSTHSFALQTYYGDENLMNISTWNTENDDENMHTAPFAGDEYFFDYEFDGRMREDIYVMPNLDGGIYGENMKYSDAWYYPDPVDHNGKPIPDFSSSFSYANMYHIPDGEVAKMEQYTVPLNYMKDLHILQGDDDDYNDFSAIDYSRVENDQWRYNMKWFRYRVYRVDPITRDNINENLLPIGDDPLLEVVYGIAEDDAMKCKISLEQIRKAVEKKLREKGELGEDEEWSYKSGELYRIVFNVDEYVTYGYTGDLSNDNNRAMLFDYEQDDYGNDWSIKTTIDHEQNAFTGHMPVASTESTVLFRCTSTDEKTERKDTDATSNVFYEPDFTPLQFDTYAIKAGEDATINFRNAKVSQADNAGTDFIDVYYQWYLSDDEIIDRDPEDPTKNADELLAGITNVCTDWSVKYLHQPENWNPEADVYDYRNSLSPDDENYEAYGEDGLHDNPDYWSMKELHAYTTELRQDWLCIRPEYLEGLSEEELEKVTLSMGNNNPFAFNTDSCYIPEDAAGKYLYVKAIVVNAKDEYTKIYDQKQVFYSHPMLIIDPSMLNPDTQEPAMDLGHMGWDGAYVSKTVNATLGEDMLFGFTGIALPESMEREFEVRLSQKVYDSQTGEVLYEADNGETINLKGIIDEAGRYYVEQTQTLYYLKPYFDKSNLYEEAIVTEEYVTARVDRFPVTVDLALPDEVYIQYPDYFEVGEPISLVAVTEPEGDFWYKWYLDNGEASFEDMEVLQESQSNDLDYIFTDETPQTFWVEVYAEDTEGNASVERKYAKAVNVRPGNVMVPVLTVKGEEVSNGDTIYVEQDSNGTIKLEVSGGTGDVQYTAYKGWTVISQENTISYETSELGNTTYKFVYGDQKESHEMSVQISVRPAMVVTNHTEATQSFGFSTRLGFFAEYIGFGVTGKIYDDGNNLVDTITDDGDFYYNEGKISYNSWIEAGEDSTYRMVLTDYFGNTKTLTFTFEYDSSVITEVRANHAQQKPTYELHPYGKPEESSKVFPVGTDLVFEVHGQYSLDPNDSWYDTDRERYGNIKPTVGNVTSDLEILYWESWDAYVAGESYETIYEGTDYCTFGVNADGSVDYYYDGNICDSGSEAPGYYRYVMEIENDGRTTYGGWAKVTVDYILLDDGQEHICDFNYHITENVDGLHHTWHCICGKTQDEEHNWNDWFSADVLVNGVWVDSNMETRYCHVTNPTNVANSCYVTQYRPAYVDALTLDHTVLSDAKIDDSVQMNASLTFKAKVEGTTLGGDGVMVDPDTRIAWASSNEDVAIVDENGKVTIVGIGNATITVTSVAKTEANGPAASASCEITASCNHVGSVLVAEKASTCSVAGCIEHYECAECGSVSLDGTFTDGKTLADVTKPLASHAVSNVWAYDATGHFRACKYGCGYVFGSSSAHTFNVSAADCVTAKYCTKCKYEAEAKHGHSLIYMDAMDATCTDSGISAAYNCMECNRYFLDADGKLETTENQLTIRALGHSWVAATCTDPKTCSRCHETEGEALGHSWRNATCESPETCGRCGETTGSALGHSWTAATCENAKTCSTCGKTDGSRLPHDYNPADATCTTDAVCADCGSIIIAATGHSYVDGKCTVCGEPEPSADITVQVSGSIPYTVSGNTVTVTHDKACKVGYLVDGKYVAVAASANSGGGYNFTVPAGVTEVVVVKKGDVTHDGIVQANDKTYLNAILLSKVTPTALESFIADVTDQGGVAANDKTFLNAVLLEKVSFSW